MLKQTKGLNAINRKQYRRALLQKGTKLIDPENEFIHEDITLTRPSAKIVWDGEAFVTVPANEPAWNVDFNTGEKTLLIEGEGTNLFDDSSSFLMHSNSTLKCEPVFNPVINEIANCKVVHDVDGTIHPQFTESEQAIPVGEDYTLTIIFESENEHAVSGKPQFRVVSDNTLQNRNRFRLTSIYSDFVYFDVNGSLSERLFTNTLTGKGVFRFQASYKNTAPNPLVRLRQIASEICEEYNIYHISLEVGVKEASSPIVTTGSAVARAADTITSAHTPTGTQLISSDGKFDATNDVSKVLPETGSFSGYTVFDKDLTAQALTRFKSDEVFVDAP